MSIQELKARCEALEQEWTALALQVDVVNIETQFFEKEVADELGVVGAVAIGIGLLHQTLKALMPLKVSTPLVTGCWALGGAFCLFRLTAGAASGWLSMTQRNTRRKKQLQLKLETLEARIQSLAALARHINHDTTPTSPEQPSVAPQQQQQPSLAHQSPTGSQSSAELVELPGDEEELVLMAGQGQQAQQGQVSQRRRGRGNEGPLDPLRQYAALGNKD